MKKTLFTICSLLVLAIPSVSYAATVSALVVGGGGQGGGNTSYSGALGYGGGGAGGLIYNSSFTVTPQTYTVTVGAGGSGTVTFRGNNGSDSIFSTLDAVGGGGGDVGPGAGAGGSGGGGGGNGGSGTGTAGQGNNGGTCGSYTDAGGGGGGGAVGANCSGITTGGAGGVGLTYSISGSSVYYAGGGGGGNAYNPGAAGAGGTGGGGNGGYESNGSSGSANTGGGGGGAGNDASGAPTYSPGNGGSGIVIISAPTGEVSAACTNCTVTTSGGNTIWIFDSSGTWTLNPYAGAAMTSTNYAISIDSVNFGGDNSTSTSYSLQDTAGEIATGNSTSTSYTMNAGYQQMYQPFLSMSVATTSAALPSISGFSGNTSTTTIATLIITDDPAGYSLTIQASSSPALKAPSGAAFSDYLPAGAAPDFTFTVPAASSTFGFSVVSPDASSRYKNNGSACNTGSTNTAFTCWDGLSVAAKTIAQSAAGNQPNGATTTIDLEAKIGASKLQDSGNYTATLTLTATAL